MSLGTQLIGDIKAVKGIVQGIAQAQSNQEESLILKILEEVKGHGVDYAGLVADLMKQKKSGEAMNDRDLLIERVIQIICRFSDSSFSRKKITEALVDVLWDSMQHPPLTYVGDKFQFRQADGSYNNITCPDLGKAGTPYARTVRTEITAPGARPDPGLLFDLLMSRGDKYQSNPGGISSMLLYHASIITHDIFHTNRKDGDISETSSYLDLAPLYGSNQDQQNKVRTRIGGQLKPDTFHEKRLLAFPPGVNVMLVMYSRFHNYVAQTLEAINEGGRFTPPPHLGLEEKQSWKDEQLFQVARLVTNGLYVNVSLHDYLRGIAGVPTTDSNWTLDPRVSIEKIFSKEGVPLGVGNQVSCEFNLLYRFHSAISDRDTKWTEDFYRTLFPGKDIKNLSVGELFGGVTQFEQSIPSDPCVRTFAGLKRGPDGKFNDDDLVKILADSIEDPAGRFGANHVPEIFRPVEILGIIQARKWNVASLNEFRKFFKLREYKTFSEISDDPYVAETLEQVYGGNIDHVEMYPGMFLETCKPRMDAGMGLCAPYTVTRAVFSDAITLVRGDRFLTLDYTPANLTNWGITEAASDNNILGGAKMHTLILNAFPNHFKFNSAYAMQPFYTPSENRKNWDKLGWTSQFNFDRPGPAPGKLIPVLSHAGLKAVLEDNKNFKVIWGSKMPSLTTYMLASDTPACAAQRDLVKEMMYGPTGALQNFATYTHGIARKLLQKCSHRLGRGGAYQVDVVNHIFNYAATTFAADMCYLPLNTTSSPSYTEAQLYRVLADLTTYVFSDADPLRSWKRRQASEEGTGKLVKEMEEIIKKLPPDTSSSTSLLTQTTGYVPKTLIGKVVLGGPKTTTTATTSTSQADICPTEGPLGHYGITFARKLVRAGKTPREVAEILVGTAAAFAPNTATACAQLLDFYLQENNATHWAEIKRLSAENTTTADEKLTRYVLEGFRLSNSLGLFRVASPENGSASVSVSTTDGATITANKGDRLFVSFVAASRDPKVFPNPNEIQLDRNVNSYLTFGEGPHQCLGKDLNIVHSRTMLKTLANLKNLRRTPGDQGKLKFIPKPGGIKLYMNPDWSDFTPYPTTMKVMFDGPP